MSHVVNIRVNKKHFGQLAKKKSIMMTPEEHHNTANTMVQLHYPLMKHAKHVMKNLESGKGVSIKPMHCSDMICEGGSIWKTISNTLKNPIVKAVAPILINAGVSAAGGSPESGAMAGNISSALLNANAKSGSGLLNRIPGRIVNSKITKSGSGFFQTVGKVASSKVTKGIARAIAPVVAQSVKDKTGSNLAGNLTTAGLNAYAGSGMRRRIKRDDGVFHGGEIENTYGLGGKRSANTFNSVQERMQYVRSHRKVSGGSFMPMGGSF